MEERTLKVHQDEPAGEPLPVSTDQGKKFVGGELVEGVMESIESVLQKAKTFVADSDVTVLAQAAATQTQVDTTSVNKAKVESIDDVVQNTAKALHLSGSTTDLQNVEAAAGDQGDSDSDSVFEESESGSEARDAATSVASNIARGRAEHGPGAPGGDSAFNAVHEKKLASEKVWTEGLFEQPVTRAQANAALNA